MKPIGPTPSPTKAPPGPTLPTDLLSTPSGMRSGRNPHEVASQFEALLLRSMVESMRKTTTADDDQPGGQMVEQLIDDALAGHLAKSGGIGLAAFVDDQVLDPQVVTPTDQRLGLERWVRSGLAAPEVTGLPTIAPKEMAPPTE